MKIDPIEMPQMQIQEEASGARSLTSAVYQILRGSILFGQLEPGAKLRVSHIADQFRVSLSAVREALARLAAEGLLETQDHRGFRVAAVSREDLLDLTQTRIDMESMALRRAIARGDDAWAERVREIFEALKTAERSRQLSQRRYKLHSDFHQALLEACGSPWLLRMLTLLFERAERYRLLSVAYARIRTQVEEEHEQLFQAAVVERDADKACEVLAQHVRQTTQALLDAEERRIASVRTAKPARKAAPARGPRKSAANKVPAESQELG